MREIQALIKVYFQYLWANKFVFIYNLVVPTAFYGYRQMTSNQPILRPITQHMFVTLSFFWSYIIVVTLLNNFVVTLIAHRELGLLKQLFFIIGSKMKLIAALFFVQFILLSIELLLFNSVVLLISRQFSLVILATGVGVAWLSALPIALLCSALLLFKIKIESVNVLTGLLLFGLLFLTGLPTHVTLHAGLLLLNPMNYVAEVAFQIYRIFESANFNPSMWLLVLAVTLLYAGVGLFALKRLTVQPVASRA